MLYSIMNNNYNSYQLFYLACYHGNYGLAQELYYSDNSILESPDRANVYFYHACISSKQTAFPQWIASLVDKHVLYNPYILIDVCHQNARNIEIAKWLYDTFPLDIALDNHFVFLSQFDKHRSYNKVLVEWLISLRPYKYYIDAEGKGQVRSDPDERWERRKYALLICYRTKLVPDISRNIALYL